VKKRTTAYPDPPRSLQAYLDGPPKVSQRALAKKAGITQGMVSLLKTGARHPRAGLARVLHELTRVPYAALLSGRRKRTHADPDDDARSDDDLVGGPEPVEDRH
jgi:transcriptional regulator with XRE-family HTH domain